MALSSAVRAPVCGSTSEVAPTNVCSSIPDLIFANGLLSLPRYGLQWTAVSGPHGNGALPTGWYQCRNFRKRVEISMTRDGVGFSVDLEPLFETTRTNLRIHPDGNVPGTLGCIGITDPDVAGCADALRRLLPGAGHVAYLQVRTLG